MTDQPSIAANIFVAVAMDASQRKRLGHGVRPAQICWDRNNRNDFNDCSIVFGNPPPDWFLSNTKLEWLQLESVGFGEYADSSFADGPGGPVVTNLAGFFAQPVAETVLAGILSLYRGIDHFVRLQQQMAWVGDPHRARLKVLAGARVVLFGYGAINRRLHLLLNAFDCAVETFDSRWSPDQLDTAMREADIVVSCVPHTPATIAVFDNERLGKLKETAIFVNAGRGSVVDEVALADALDFGRLAGAVLDVTVEEPLPENHRLWSCPNTILTQHTGGGSGDEIDRKIDVFLDNLRRFRSGEPLVGVVDFSRGY